MAYFYPNIVYGFEDMTSKVLRNSGYQSVRVYALDVEHEHNRNPFIGIECYINGVTGSVSYTQKDYDELQQFVKKYKVYHGCCDINLGYNACISGDWDSEYDLYTFDDDKDALWRN